MCTMMLCSVVESTGEHCCCQVVMNVVPWYNTDIANCMSIDNVLIETCIVQILLLA